MTKYLYHFAFVTPQKEVMVVIEQGKTIELLSVEELSFRKISEVLNYHFPNFVVKSDFSPVVLNFDVINENSQAVTVILYLIYIEEVDFEDNTFNMHIDTCQYGYLSSITEDFIHPDLNIDSNDMLKKYAWPLVKHIL